MEHIDWIDTNNIVLANSSSDYSYKKMILDVCENEITKVRLLRVKNKEGIKNYFRYNVGDEICWFYLSNNEPRKSVYYTHIYSINLAEINELNSLYKAFDREDKLNQLFSIHYSKRGNEGR